MKLILFDPGTVKLVFPIPLYVPSVMCILYIDEAVVKLTAWPIVLKGLSLDPSLVSEPFESET